MSWDDLPRDVQKLIMDMRFDVMREEAEEREQRFWAAVSTAVWEKCPNCSSCNEEYMRFLKQQPMAIATKLLCRKLAIGFICHCGPVN